MSLTSELAGGPLAAWFRERFPATEAAAAVAGDLEARPRRGPPGGRGLGAGHWAAVGGAVGTRLGWAVEPAPPYYALLGAHRGGLIGWDPVNTAAGSFRTHRADGARPPEAAPAELLGWRPTPAGWVDTAPPRDQRPSYRQSGSHGDLVTEFAARAGAFLDRVPPGHLGTPGEETVLARVALVLGDWEHAYRRGAHLSLAARAGLDEAEAAGGNPAALLAAVDPTALADTTALIAHARRHGLLDQLAAAAGGEQPGPAGALSGHAFPTFVEQWADGDLLLDPGHGDATTLIDVKTVMSARSPSTVLRWCWQLLGYALLADCFAPEWRLGRVGLCFPRHAHVVSWDVDELAVALAAQRQPEPLAAARRDFERVFRETLAVRGLRACEA